MSLQIKLYQQKKNKKRLQKNVSNQNQVYQTQYCKIMLKQSQEASKFCQEI
ncbi:unnamed protein product [Paramecium octaurelia]|uniref:Uncharacterized protein n=1 Tax=Paramecium octaurelia TaxID=43137 RepID=A0A8S1XK27_PAROT|nr:unnamed protein product [Paramecium octaurelia]